MDSLQKSRFFDCIKTKRPPHNKREHGSKKKQNVLGGITLWHLQTEASAVPYSSVNTIVSLKISAH